MQFRPNNPFATMEYTPNSGIQALKDWLDTNTPQHPGEYGRGFDDGFSQAQQVVADIVNNIGESLSGRIIDGLEADVEELQEQSHSILKALVQVDSALHIAHEHYSQSDIIRAKIECGVKLDESDLEYINEHLK